jgi:polyribonucleotide nucleotidyltransferase
VQYYLTFPGAIRIGDVDGELIINPTKQQLQQSSLNLVIASTEHKIGRNFVIKVTVIKISLRYS